MCVCVCERELCVCLSEIDKRVENFDRTRHPLALMLDASIKIVCAKLFHQKKDFCFCFWQNIFWLKNLDMLFNLKYRFIIVPWHFIFCLSMFFMKKYFLIFGSTSMKYFLSFYWQLLLWSRYCHLQKTSLQSLELKKPGSALGMNNVIISELTSYLSHQQFCKRKLKDTRQ